MRCLKQIRQQSLSWMAGICLALVVLPFVQAMAAEDDLWFPVGEVLRYKLYWGIVPVGEAVFETSWENYRGRPVIHLRVQARTTAVVAKIFPVEDDIMVLVDPETFLPLVYEQRIREGRKRRHDVVRFDHAARRAYWQSLLKEREREFEIDADTRDVLTLIYYLRATGFEEGRHVWYRVVVDDKLYDLEVTGLGRDRVRVPGYGRVACLEVEPRAKFGEIFERRGEVRGWFSMDERRVCTLMTGKVPLASVRAVLTDVEGPGDDFWIRKRKE